MKKNFILFVFSICISGSELKAQVLASDSLALVALYNSTNGPGWTRKDNWLTGPVSSWWGVSVSGNRVVSINTCIQCSGLPFVANNLQGSIPPELGNLSGLVNLILVANHLTGVIPPQLGNMTNLTYLRLDLNQLTGSIPLEIGNLVNLTNLDLSQNQLSGNIPPDLGNLPNLKLLNLCSNDLSGVIPNELGNLLNLEGLSLCFNQLTGFFPSEIANLSNLSGININVNQLFDLPDLKALPLINLSVGDNYFQFDDIQLNLGITGLYYLSQKPIQGGGNVSLLARQTFVASFSVGGNSNVYQWRKNGVNVVGANTNTISISSVSLSDEGSYELMVTNPQVPNLTLLSEPIVLSVSAALIEVKIDDFVKLDEDQVEFKTIGIGSSNIKDLIITNRGNTQLVVSNIEITGDFSLTNPLPSTIDPGESELLSIRFAPTNLVECTGTITIHSNADVQVYTLNLVGEGDAEPEVYNVVTVNENSKHDFLNIRNITLFPKNRVSIYDRWGNMVFEKDNYDNVNTTFTGTTDSGKELAEGTYYYVIDKNNGSQRITGFLLLKR